MSGPSRKLLSPRRTMTFRFDAIFDQESGGVSVVRLTRQLAHSNGVVAPDGLCNHGAAARGSFETLALPRRLTLGGATGLLAGQTQKGSRGLADFEVDGLPGLRPQVTHSPGEVERVSNLRERRDRDS